MRDRTATRLVLGVTVVLFLFLHFRESPRVASSIKHASYEHVPEAIFGYGRGRVEAPIEHVDDDVRWIGHSFFPVRPEDLHHLPYSPYTPLPRIQHEFGAPTPAEEAALKVKSTAVKDVFMRSWRNYRQTACTNTSCHDELRPVSGGVRDPFCGWGATLVDSLDMLLILGEEAEFASLKPLMAHLDFTKCLRPDIPLFEATIRYLGGLLSAFDLDHRRNVILLEKAVELADVLMGSFDTPNRMPMTNYAWEPTSNEGPHRARSTVVLSELASLSLEFTRLTQLSGNHSYYDAIARITNALEAFQPKSAIPGMWPEYLDASGCKISPEAVSECGYQDEIVASQEVRNDTFSLAGKSDSAYEYLPKEHQLLNGADGSYKKMYTRAADAIRKRLLFRPMTPEDADILVAGSVSVDKSTKKPTFAPYQSHLTCFAGGQFALGAKLFDLPEDLHLAERLTDGCIWAYKTTETNIMPEDFFMAQCPAGPDRPCAWNEEVWRMQVDDLYSSHGDQINPDFSKKRLPHGITGIRRTTYLLRPEAMESIFYMYRITGDQKWREEGWKMFQAIEAVTRTELGASSIDDVTITNPVKTDIMQSFWLTETLKYCYLLFSNENLLSLDNYVFNTEGHPFMLQR